MEKQWSLEVKLILIFNLDIPIDILKHDIQKSSFFTSWQINVITNSNGVHLYED